MGKLRYSVAACTSADATVAASDGAEQVPTSLRYMTARNCSYPQEIVLQLKDGRCRLTHVQILSHETHIARKLELFVSPSLSFDTNNDKDVGDVNRFRRLGFVRLKPNTESTYRARELKTAHVQAEAALLKLRIHDCYVNEHNRYNQVGIMAIHVYGEPLSLLTSCLADEEVGARSFVDEENVMRDGTIDWRRWTKVGAEMAARIREIQVAKDRAVDIEDYDQAKILKQREEKLRSFGLELARLEAQKREAAAMEDYDKAKKIKQEIRRLEAMVSSNEMQPVLPIPTTSGFLTKSQAMPQCQVMHRSFLNSSSRDTYLEVSQVVKKGSLYDEGHSVLRRSAQGCFSEYNEQESARGRDDAEQGDGKRRSLNPHFERTSGAANLPEPDELPAELAKESEKLVSVIGSFSTRCLYSNLWNHRDAAIRKVTMEMNNYTAEPIEVLEVCSFLAQSGVGDRIAQVALAAFCLVDRMVSFGASIRKDDMCRILGNTMTQIVNKLGEPHAKLRKKAVVALEHLAAAENVGVAFVALHLSKCSNTQPGLKLLQGRLLVLKKLLAAFNLVPGTVFTASGIMAFLEGCNCLAHQSREIREAGKDITVLLYRVVGNEVHGYLKSLRPKQLADYQAAFDAAETAKTSNPDGSFASVLTAGYSTCRLDKLSYEPKIQFERGVEDVVGKEDGELMGKHTCPFCGVVNENSDTDQHFWKSCKMLTPCKMCGQVIEISLLTDHLLTECEMRQNYRECPRCGEAIINKFFERHVSLNDCPLRVLCGNRCPLCHEDTAPGKNGWRHHLLDEGCPSNPRR
uniref:TOG domain-containing protein n=1 Tax=Peronospora matthiolae TaxID=2874970 RepID=A0AAV1TPU6_9STRA